MPEAPHDDRERADLELIPPPSPTSWRRERIGWALLAIVLAAALVGVFGPGPLSRATMAAGGVRLEYDRFVRMSAATVLRVTLPVDPGGSGEVLVALDHTYLDRIRVHTILPEPKRMVARPGAIEFVFAAASDGAPVTAWFYVTLEKPGIASGGFAAAGETLRFWQLSYP